MSEGPLQVAVAEDECDSLQFLEEVIVRLGWKVAASASNGRELLEKARKAKPDVLITDLRTPGMDGIELARRLNEERRTPVTFLSAFHDDEVIVKAEADYAMAYLIKPIGEADLKATVPLAVRRFRQSEAATAESHLLQQALEERKVIEQAKGILVCRLGRDEAACFRGTRHAASSTNINVVDLGRRVIAAEEVFQQIEDAAGRA